MGRPKSRVLAHPTVGVLLKGAEQIKVPLSKLRLDPDNARLRYLGRLNDAELEQAIWKEPSVREWYTEIKEDGGITEPLTVTSNYVVKEGNERLVCLRKLAQEAHDGILAQEALEGKLPQYPKDQFDIVPCQKIPPHLSEQDIAIWLARIHVKGKHRWKSVNKALMIYELSTKYELSYEQIRKRLAISKKTVQTTITAYEATLQYRAAYGTDADWYYKYSYYYEIFKNEQLRTWIRKNGNFDLFGDWIHSGKIPRGEAVRKLKEITADPQLLSEFKSATVTLAKEILDSFDTGGSKSLKTLVKAREALREFPLGELRTIVSDPLRWKVVGDLYQELENFIKNAESLKKGETALAEKTITHNMER